MSDTPTRWPVFRAANIGGAAAPWWVQRQDKEGGPWVKVKKTGRRMRPGAVLQARELAEQAGGVVVETYAGETR